MAWEFSDGFSSFRNGVFGQFSWEDQFHSWLDFSGAKSVFFVVSNQLGGLLGNSVEGVVDEWVHDGHGFLGDSGFRVNLFQNFVDVDSEGFDSLFVSFVSFDFFGGGFGDGGGFFGWHF
jgi:hypothetical protein